MLNRTEECFLIHAKMRSAVRRKKMVMRRRESAHCAWKCLHCVVHNGICKLSNKFVQMLTYSLQIHLEPLIPQCPVPVLGNQRPYDEWYQQVLGQLPPLSWAPIVLSPNCLAASSHSSFDVTLLHEVSELTNLYPPARISDASNSFMKQRGNILWVTMGTMADSPWQCRFDILQGVPQWGHTKVCEAGFEQAPKSLIDKKCYLPQEDHRPQTRDSLSSLPTMQFFPSFWTASWMILDLSCVPSGSSPHLLEHEVHAVQSPHLQMSDKRNLWFTIGLVFSYQE